MAESQRRRAQGGHFTPEAWADFARGQSEPARKAPMERHLAEGCERCARTLDLWTGVVGLAGDEASYAPPDEVVERIRARFARSRPAGLMERAARRVALIFDSVRQPALAGVRAGGAAPRQLLYKAGRYLIRLQLEQETGSENLLVVGQIVDESNPSETLQDLPVLLSDGQETLDRTLTNTLGEFQLRSAPSKDLRLSVGIPEIGTLTLPGLLAGAGGPDGDDLTGGGSGRRIKARHPPGAER